MPIWPGMTAMMHPDTPLLAGMLAEIKIEHLVRIALDHGGLEHHVGDGPIAVPRRQLRAEHALVDLELLPGEAGEQSDHVGDALVLGIAVHQLGDSDGAGIDHGVERAVGHLVEHDRVERPTRRLDPHMLQHRRAAIALKRIAVHERFRHGLNGEGDLGVPGRIELAVDGGDGDAEQGGVGLAELGDVVGRLAAGQPGDGACSSAR